MARRQIQTLANVLEGIGYVTIAIIVDWKVAIAIFLCVYGPRLYSAAQEWSD